MIVSRGIFLDFHPQHQKPQDRPLVSSIRRLGDSADPVEAGAMDVKQLKIQCRIMVDYLLMHILLRLSVIYLKKMKQVKKQELVIQLILLRLVAMDVRRVKIQSRIVVDYLLMHILLRLGVIYLKKMKQANKQEVSAAFVDLPEELVLEILMRLGVMDLNRLKLVSKPLNSLIASPKFNAQYTLHNPNQPYILITGGTAGNFEVLSVGLGDVGVQFQGSGIWRCSLCCEGVFLAYTLSDTRYCLWNPATAELRPLPIKLGELELEAEYNMEYSYGDFHLSLSGCGFDSRTRHYKPFFVCSHSWEEEYHHVPLVMVILLYSYNNVKGWTRKIIESRGIVSHGRHCRSKEPVYAAANGFCHWVGFSSIIGSDILISFDFTSEVITTTALPRNIRANLIPYGDSFALIEHRRFPNRKYYEFDSHEDAKAATSFDIHNYDIWVLGQLGNANTWIKLFTVGPLHSIENLLGFWNQNHVLVCDTKYYMVSGRYFRMQHCDGGLFVYDTITKQALKIRSNFDLDSTEVIEYRQQFFPILVDDSS